MGRMSKWELATVLKNNGWFSKYRYVDDMVKDMSWNTLNTYYRELVDFNLNVRGTEQ